MEEEAFRKLRVAAEGAGGGRGQGWEAGRPGQAEGHLDLHTAFQPPLGPLRGAGWAAGPGGAAFWLKNETGGRGAVRAASAGGLQGS